MSSGRDEGPVYYREIQKNAYLKRIPNDEVGSMFRPLGHKKPPLKPMWTLLCVHNGRTPFLEQYPSADSPATLSHKPVWRACLKATRHVTASVKPRAHVEHDFLVDTDSGCVRMLAPDWESMQDWVTTLRSKLCELKILSAGENVYCPAPLAAPPRAAARDPTSPLPPTPPVPPHRVPGIEITTIPRSQPEPTPDQPDTTPEQPPLTNPHVDISNWDTPFNSLPGTSSNGDHSLHSVTSTNVTSTNITSTSVTSIQSSEEQDKKMAAKSVAKICGQNICLDDSILKRHQNSTASTDSDEELFSEMDHISDSMEALTVDNASTVTEIQPPTSNSNEPTTTLDRSETNLNKSEGSSDDGTQYKQRVVVNKPGLGRTVSDTGDTSDHQSANVTVIQVSNKAPHTAIPVMGPETDIFDFSFPQNLPVNTQTNDTIVKITDDSPNIKVNDKNDRKFVNIVNTEGIENGYGTVFDKSDYGHLSLTTTVNLTGCQTVQTCQSVANSEHVATCQTVTSDSEKSDGIYERLCLASTSIRNASPLPVRKIKSTDVHRKSSLPNLDVSSESTYEYLFPSEQVTVSKNNNIASNSISNRQTDVRNNISEIRNTNQVPIRLDDQQRIENISTRNNTVNLQSRSRVNKHVISNQINLSEQVLSSQTGNLSDRTGNLSNQTGNLLNQTGNLSDRTGNLSNQTGILSNQIGNLSSPTGILSNQTVNLSSQTGNLSNQTVNISNQTGILSNQTGNLTNQRDYLSNRTGNLSNQTVNLSSDQVVPSQNVNMASQRRNVERSHSQNAYDSSPRSRDLIRRQHCSPKRDGKNEKNEPPAKPIWKRGLTELSLLSRLRGIGQTKRQESPTRHDSENDSRSPALVLDEGGGEVARRSRGRGAGGQRDLSRRRSSSLTSANRQSPPPRAAPPLQPLRARQAASLAAEQRRGAAVCASLVVRDPPVFVTYERQVWIACWSCGGSRWFGRAGDRVAGVGGVRPRDANHARQLVKGAHTHKVDILFHRVPLGKMFVINKRDLETTGIKLDSECNIISVEKRSAAARAGIPPPGKWAVTEVNNRPINLIKGGEEEMNRLSLHGSEVSVLIQPSALVKKIRAALKSTRPLLSLI